MEYYYAIFILEKLMQSPFQPFSVVAAVVILCWSAYAQANEVCGSVSGGSVWASTRAVYGRIAISGQSSGQKFPKVTVTLFSQGRSLASSTIDRSGNYCFLDVNGSGATLIVELEGREVGRQDLPMSTLGINQLRQDFEIAVGEQTAKPGNISAKYQYPRAGKNAELFDAANIALKEKDKDKATSLIKQLVETDPRDFIAWAMLGSIYFEKNDLTGAESAFQKALAARPDLGVAMMNIGRIRLMQNQVDSAIDFLLRATKADPNYARSFQLLGEAYLLARKGTLGVDALNQAIDLDPFGMAECHLLLARLYDRAGAKNFASREYRRFLEKVPGHPDKKKFEKYIADNPDVVN